MAREPRLDSQSAGASSLVDGGLPRPVPDGVDPEAPLEATLGPAMTRLRQTYADTDAYLAFWRAHPALADHWTADVEAYARYDVIGEPGDDQGACDRGRGPR